VCVLFAKLKKRIKHPLKPDLKIAHDMIQKLYIAYSKTKMKSQSITTEFEGIQLQSFYYKTKCIPNSKLSKINLFLKILLRCCYN